MQQILDIQDEELKRQRDITLKTIAYFQPEFQSEIFDKDGKIKEPEF